MKTTIQKKKNLYIALSTAFAVIVMLAIAAAVIVDRYPSFNVHRIQGLIIDIDRFYSQHGRYFSTFEEYSAWSERRIRSEPYLMKNAWGYDLFWRTFCNGQQALLLDPGEDGDMKRAPVCTWFVECGKINTDDCTMEIKDYKHQVVFLGCRK